MKKKNKRILICSILFCIFSTMFIVSYAFFNYTGYTNAEAFETGSIYLNLDSGEEISLSTMFPETQSEAEARTDNYLDFTVKGENTYNKTVYYSIKTLLGDIPTDKTNDYRFNDENIKIELIDLDNNETLLVSRYSDLDETCIYVRTVLPTKSEFEHKYRIRMWLDADSTLISDTDENKTYCASSNCDVLIDSDTTNDLPIYKDLFASLKMNISAGFNKDKAYNSEFCFTTQDIDEDNVQIVQYNNICGKNLIIPETINGKTVSSFYQNTFAGNTVIEYAEIPSTVTTLPDCLFQNATNLKKVVLPDTLISIGNATFMYCSSLEDINLPEGLTTIMSDTFGYCSSLKNITLPSTLTTLHSATFEYCTSLEGITVPATVTSVGMGIFYNCTGLVWAEYLPTDTNLYGYFTGCTSLEYLVLGNANHGDRNINIPDSVKYIKLVDGITSIGKTEFTSLPNLISINIPDTVTSIGETAFTNCSSLKSIDIPSSVTSIGTNAFNACSSLENVTLHEGLQSLGTAVFGGCTSLKSIIIPSSVTYMEPACFSGDSNLTDVWFLPTNLTPSTSYSIFDGCTNLTNLYLANANYGGTSFYDNTYIKNLYIMDGCTSIADNEFEKFSNLEHIYIPSTVTTIGSHAFDNCSNLTNIEIPYGVTTIGSYVFYGCTSLTSVIIPSSVATVGTYLFNGSSAKIYLNWTSNIPTFTTDSFSSSSSWNLYVPYGTTSVYQADAVLGSSIMTINEFYTNPSCFTYETVGTNKVKITGINSTCSSNTSFYIPESDGTNLITEIGTEVFKSNSLITVVTLPSTITKIGTSAFESSSINVIGINSGLNTIDASAFKNTNNLNYSYDYGNGSSTSSIRLPYSLENIGNYAFYQSEFISNLSVIPEGVESIGSYAFVGADITSLTLPTTLKVVSDNAFDQDASLTTVNILSTDTSNYSTKMFGTDSNISTLTVAIFDDIPVDSYSTLKTSVKTLTILNASDTIILNSFSNLETLNLPFGIIELHLDSLPKLTSIDIPNSVTAITITNTGLTSLTLPYSLNEIEDYAFEDNNSLNELTIRYGVKKIGNYAFETCGIFDRTGTFIIANSVTEIGDYAFSGGYRTINKLYLPSSLEKIGKKAFKDVTTINFLYSDITDLEHLEFEYNVFNDNISGTLFTSSNDLSDYQNHRLFRKFSFNIG